MQGHARAISNAVEYATKNDEPSHGTTMERGRASRERRALSVAPRSRENLTAIGSSEPCPGKPPAACKRLRKIQWPTRISSELSRRSLSKKNAHPPSSTVSPGNSWALALCTESRSAAREAAMHAACRFMLGSSLEPVPRVPMTRSAIPSEAARKMEPNPPVWLISSSEPPFGSFLAESERKGLVDQVAMSSILVSTYIETVSIDIDLPHTKHERLKVLVHLIPTQGRSAKIRAGWDLLIAGATLPPKSMFLLTSCAHSSNTRNTLQRGLVELSDTRCMKW